MSFLKELTAERGRFMDTIEGLTDEEFEHGRTLCALWTPRDVLAHAIGSEDIPGYVRALGRVNLRNKEVVDGARNASRADLIARGRRWASAPNLAGRLSASFLIGDVSVHHQDIVRGLGRTRDLPHPVSAAIFREGVVLSTFSNRYLLRHRVVPTTPGGRRLGRGPEVRGTSEVLGLWLAGREGLDRELEFA